MADDKKGDDKEKKKSGGNTLLLVILVLLVLLLGVAGFIAWKLVSAPPAAPAAGKAPAAAEETRQEDEGPPVMIDMDDITVNLADEGATRFLRAKIKLEVHGEEAKKKVEENMVKIRDLAITVLGGKTFDEVRTPHGKFALKEELIYRINRLLGANLVRNLYFAEFVAQ